MKNKIYYIFIWLILAVGILLRVISYSHGKPFWIDEEALAGSIIAADSLEYFFHPLKFFQKAPPLFMCATYLISNLFGIKEFILRIIPFICSLLSIPLFFAVSKYFLKSKKSIILANALFAINYQLIYYCEEFKPYASDMFVTLLLIYLSKFIDLDKFSRFKVFLYSLGSIVMLLFSFPSMFTIGAIYIVNISKIKDKIKHLIYLAPITICGIWYYIELLLPLRNREIKYFISYWGEGFIKPNISSIWNIIEYNIKYIFYPNNGILLILFFFAGIFLFFKNNNQKIRIYIIVFILTIIASALHLYPMKGRMILYLIPFTILVVTKPLDLVQIKKPTLALIIITTYLIPFLTYGNLNYYNYFFIEDTIMWQDSRTALEIIIKNIKPEEIIVYNNASGPSMYYYSHYFNLDDKNEIIKLKSEYNEKDYFRELDKLERNKSYWFYYPYHLNKKPEIQFVKKWVIDRNLKAEYFIYKKSFVAHIQPN